VGAASWNEKPNYEINEDMKISNFFDSVAIFCVENVLQCLISQIICFCILVLQYIVVKLLSRSWPCCVTYFICDSCSVFLFIIMLYNLLYMYYI
jgi:hypothetical protein